MNITFKSIIPIIIITLIISSTIVPSILGETKLINNKKSDLARKHIIYISGNGLEEITYKDYYFQGPLNFLYRFYGFNDSYVGMFFNITENILIIKDGIPQTIKGPVKIEFGLSDPNTFAFLVWSREGKSFALGYCLFIVIDPLYE